MNFSIIANIFVGKYKHFTLIMMLTSKSFLFFFNFFLPSSLATEVLNEHMILNKIFNQKQVKMKRLEYPSCDRTTGHPSYVNTTVFF
jgi:hypothetical protein